MSQIKAKYTFPNILLCHFVALSVMVLANYSPVRRAHHLSQDANRIADELGVGFYEDLDRLSFGYANNPRDLIVLVNKLLEVEKSTCDEALLRYVDYRGDKSAARVLLLVPLLYPDNIQTSKPPHFFNADKKRWGWFCSSVILINDIPFSTEYPFPSVAEPENDIIIELLKWCGEHGVRRDENLFPVGNPFRIVDSLEPVALYRDFELGTHTENGEIRLIESMRWQAAQLVKNILPPVFTNDLGLGRWFKDKQDQEWQKLVTFGDSIQWNFTEYRLTRQAFEILTAGP